MLRPPQLVSLPWLQPGGLELLLQAPPPCPPPSPCLAKAGAAMPAPTTTAAINAAAAIPLAITPPPQSSCCSQNAWVLVAVPPGRVRGAGRRRCLRRRQRAARRRRCGISCGSNLAYIPPVHRREILGIAAAIAVAGKTTVTRAEAQPLLVFMAASLKNALDDIDAGWRRGTGKRTSIAYAASSLLAKQIENGAPADLFISADSDWMDYLETRKLIKPGSRSDLLGN